ncbi:MAG TPA: alpha/beta hydrolase [Bryobacteraceae bacterium]|nr:alpha/beta hydrolase [Bryobacteraceae bacterium]
MKPIYKSPEGERLVRERYLAFLNRWPVPNRQLRIPTGQGVTFVIASGAENAPPLLLLHGGAGNSAMWIGDMAAFAAHFRVFAIDMIGEAGLSAPSRPPLASEAHAQWLDEILDALALDRVSIAGISLGGWLALDYATRRPHRVERIAVLCPGGIGRQKLGIVFATIALRLCGTWGKRKLRERILGRPPSNASPGLKAFIAFVALIHEHFRTRMVKLPTFSDEALRRLTMPVLAIVGGRDVLLDSAGTKRRLERNAPRSEVVVLPEAGHVILGQTQRIVSFLR